MVSAHSSMSSCLKLGSVQASLSLCCILGQLTKFLSHCLTLPRSILSGYCDLVTCFDERVNPSMSYSVAFHPCPGAH